MIHQLVHTLSYGDAISGEVLALQRAFRALGEESEIFAINVHPHFRKNGIEVRAYTDLPKNFSEEIVLHYSLGSPLNALYAELRAATRTLIYHNLTPSRWFRGVNPRIVRDIEQGERELPALCAMSDRLIADSRFNASELAKINSAASVLELPIDPSRWSEPRNEGIYHLLKGDPVVHLVHVGRLAPNKCVEDIIKVFYFLHHYVAKGSKLWLSGIDIDTEIYSFALKRLAHELGVADAVRFTGCMADSEIRALYEAGSAYLCMSEHEGFCLPVVEAMHFGLPVLAYDGSALTDTVGEGGILFREKRHAEIAELVAEVHYNPTLRQALVESGRRRVASLSFERFQARLAEIFAFSTRAAHPTP